MALPSAFQCRARISICAAPRGHLHRHIVHRHGIRRPRRLIQVQVNPSGLAAGVYQKNIVFSGAAGNSPFTVPVTLTVTSSSGAGAAQQRQ